MIRFKRLFFTVAVVALLAFVACLTAYPYLERNYQRNMDTIRKRDAESISSVLREYAEKTGSLPFHDLHPDSAVMCIIGRSSESEAKWASEPALQRDARYVRSSDLEKELSAVLGRTISLPHEPQSVPTFAPNVYVVFTFENEATVVSHLKFPAEDAVPYAGPEGLYYAYTVTFVVAPESTGNSS